MLRYWWEVLWQGMWNSVAGIGQSKQGLGFTVLVLFLGAIYIWRIRGRKAMKENIYKTIPEVIIIGMLAWIPFLLGHIAHNSYIRWKNASDDSLRIEMDFQKYKKDVESMKPDLRPEITTLMVAPAGDREHDSIVTIVGRISNLGSPGVVQDYWLDLEFGESRILHGQFPLAPDVGQRLFVGQTASGNQMYLSGSRHLFNAVTMEPLERNASKIVWLTAVFRGITQQQILDQKPTVVLTCNDVTGRKTSARRDFGQGGGQAPFGIDEIQKPSPPKKH